MTGGDVDEGVAGDDVDGFGQPQPLVIEVFFEMPAEADHRLGGGSVSMDGQNRAGLDGVQHVPLIIIYHPRFSHSCLSSTEFPVTHEQHTAAKAFVPLAETPEQSNQL